MITPAISVLGAVEGLEVVTPLLRAVRRAGHRRDPRSALFVIQKYGTHRVGGLFGPIMIVWFLTIAALGVMWIVRAPAVLGGLRSAACGHASSATTA